MRFVRETFVRLSGIMRGGTRPDEELTEELESHREMLVQEYRRAGRSESEARRLAAARFGSMPSALETYRDQRGLPILEHWIRDCRYGVRSLNRTRTLSLSMILVLALGIGLSTTVATVFHAAVWRPLAVPEPERVVKLALSFEGTFNRRVHGHVSQFSYPEVELYQSVSRTLSGVAAVRHETATWLRNGERQTLAAAMVTGNYFSTLQVRASAGRLLAEADEHQPVAVISDRLWTKAFARDAAALGAPMLIDREPYAVIGVAQPGFLGTEVDAVDVWLPLETAAPLRGDAARLGDANLSWLQAFGRLAPGAPLAAASAEAQLVAARLDASDPGRRVTINVTAASALDAGLLRGPDRNRLLAVGLISGLVSTLLLVICTSNAAAMLLARSAARQQEIALRIALGASRGRIVQQILAESVLVAISAALAGLLLCSAVLRACAHLLPLPAYFAGFVPDTTVLLFAMSSAAGATLFFGLLPAIQASLVDPLPTIKRGGASLGRRVPAARLRQWLVSAQIAVALVLLVASALLARGIERALRVDPGFSPKNLYVITVDLPATASNAVDRARIGQRLLEGLRAGGPGVESGAAAVAPFSGKGFSPVRPSGGSEPVSVNFNIVDAGYFRALGISPVAGRALMSHDDPTSVVVNARLARAFWSDERTAIGKSIEFPDERPAPGSAVPPAPLTDADAPMRTATIVGVVPTLQSTDPGVADGPTLYVTADNLERSAGAFVVRSPSRAQLEWIVADVLGTSDASAAVVSIEQRLFGRTAAARAAAVTIVLIGILALLVAGAGIYGIVAHSVVSRTHEIGVHIALGASRSHVLRLVLKSSVRAIAAGAAVGGGVVMVAAAVASRTMEPLLFGLPIMDPAAIFAAVLFLSVLTLSAAYIPARRAFGAGPIEALRHI